MEKIWLERHGPLGVPSFIGAGEYRGADSPLVRRGSSDDLMPSGNREKNIDR
jgi:hypothetical protein